ncbi:MAG: hypothetical protein HYZ61_01995 [Candidatus Andersenbacteria bacterium]|nr:hypothetical protein [Candidatus Andersenbacteria bacterium]
MTRWKLPSFLILFLLLPVVAEAALIDQVNQAFRSVYGRTPTTTEWQYWAGRVQNKEKTTYDALVGAMSYQKGSTGTAATVTVAPSSIAASSVFKTSRSAYPSSHNPNFLPEGTLVKSASKPQVFYIQNGNKSWVLSSILDRWLGENHYYKHDIILTISDADLARYTQTKSVNPIYIGKILQHPAGTQYFIDDKLRKREISPSVRAAFKIPAGNLYPTSSAHLSEFPTGPAITKADKYPGGMIVYTGPYHGGRFWKIEEVEAGKLIKRLYLTDYIYEADANPDESHRAPAIDAILARHERGPNIERYPDGWTASLDGKIFVVENGSLRHVGSPEILAAMGHNPKNALSVFPEFLRKYPRGYAITAFKSIVGNTSGSVGPAAAPNTSVNLTKVRPAIRAIIGDMNNIYYSVFDKDVTAAENKFWVDYIYNGEVATKVDLVAAMKRTKTTGIKPARTSRTATLSESRLESHWFPYLFYFVHQKEASQEDKNYWYGRIQAGDRDTIEELGGTIQWIKDNFGATRK